MLINQQLIVRRAHDQVEVHRTMFARIAHGNDVEAGQEVFRVTRIQLG